MLMKDLTGSSRQLLDDQWHGEDQSLPLIVLSPYYVQIYRQMESAQEDCSQLCAG